MKKQIINKILMVFFVSIAGCSGWKSELSYDYPVWGDNSDTIYCVETEYKYKELGIVFHIDEGWTHYLTSMDTNGDNKQRLFLMNGGGPISISSNSVIYQNNGIWSTDLEGNNYKQITSTPTGSFELSPKGNKIAYKSTINNEIWLINIDGTEHKKIWDSANYEVCWSTDNIRIAIGLEESIILLNVDDNEYTTINNARASQGIDWFPNGNEILFANELGLYLINIDGTNKGKIRDSTSRPQLSPDGTKIVSSGILVSNSDGSNVKLIAPPEY